MVRAIDEPMYLLTVPATTSYPRPVPLSMLYVNIYTSYTVLVCKMLAFMAGTTDPL